eukprot:CAMPEP_0180382500 /NCGR_PEP_ID=MMETSP0989-20121125/27387_1 /TAXON_ID=697907 /ORGANISM="non described non described, Strain CCMP2293" /LENGTH=95 /DNA_ID=CAMNT_0022382597 /DNA_START=48 /DNA_END=333 /DNA_ORIENTATION=+
MRASRRDAIRSSDDPLRFIDVPLGDVASGRLLEPPSPVEASGGAGLMKTHPPDPALPTSVGARAHTPRRFVSKPGICAAFGGARRSPEPPQVRTP